MARRRNGGDEGSGGRKLPRQLRGFGASCAARSRGVSEVVTLGCRLNLAESERLAAMLAGAGNVVVVNSCAVTGEALRQTRQAIRRARRANPDARLLVTGCAAEIDRAAIAAMPEVDGLVSNHAKLDPRAWNLPLPDERPAAPRRTRAFIAVQNGCDHACSFCVIPMGRGPSRSRPAAAVIAEVESACRAGAREVVLTGVDLASWGADLAQAPRLGQLVGEILDAVPALLRLRLSSLDPAAIDERLLALFAGAPRLMPHLHLSLQHGDDLMLKRMKRRHRRAAVIALVAGLRARRPDLAIGADLIAGFPTEDEAAHHANLSIIAELGIVHGHVFPFSARAPAPASRMPQTAAATIRARAAELRAALDGARESWLRSLVGQPLEILAERDGTGHSRHFARMALPARTAPGELVTLTPGRVIEGLLG
ncbi:MAG: MiaB/RimO family radical SAM methylthiotransferase [Sphingomonadales bacterium]|nr:MiaB/RimO family radical SAM methylthiotransferase [Sphingomonadales bacterium]